MIAPIGSMPTPVATAVSMPTVAPVAPVAPAPRSNSDTRGDGRAPERQATIYGRSGIRSTAAKGRLVDRDA